VLIKCFQTDTYENVREGMTVSDSVGAGVGSGSGSGVCEETGMDEE
jgi:hypothetical protein